jgi:hypothetical protein
VVWGYGIQVLVGTAVCAVVVVRSAVAVRRDAVSTGFARYAGERIALFAVPPLLYAVAGILLVGVPASSVGLVFVAVGTILAIVTTVLFSWVALVEVLR